MAEEKKPNFIQKLIATIKKPFQKLAADNPYFKSTMKRINIKSALYGHINYRVKDGDFKQGSYISFLDGNFIIYGSAQEDYIVNSENIASMELTGSTIKINVGNAEFVAACCILTFKDGKKAMADIISERLGDFKFKLGI